MDDSSLFLQWVANTLQHRDPGVLADDGAFPSLQVVREASQAAAVVLEPTELAEAAKSWSSGSGGGGQTGSVRSMSLNLGGTSVPRSILATSWNFGAVSVRVRPSGGTLDVTFPVAATIQETVYGSQPTSWNFGAVSARSSGGTLDVTFPVAATIQETVYGSQPTRRASGTGSASAAYNQCHIMAERKRREKINQRFIELSAVIPGLKKMDKATILTEAVRHLKELQERVNALEAAAGASNVKSIQTKVLLKKACLVAPSDDNSSLARPFAAPARSLLPEIEAKVSENNAMVRIHCDNGKGLVVRVLAEAEELNLRIVNSNVMPFTASTVIITIMAKVEEGFTVKSEDIVGRLNSALHQHSCRCC